MISNVWPLDIKTMVKVHIFKATTARLVDAKSLMKLGVIMKKPTLYSKLALALAATGLMAACSSDNDPAAGPAVFSLGLSDAPVEEASQVMVCFEGVELVGNGQSPVNLNVGDQGVVAANDACLDDTGNVIPNTHGVDLLTLQGATSADFISGIEVEPGEYGQLRLNMAGDGSFVETHDGNIVPLRVPSNQLRLDGVTLMADQEFEYTLEFDLRRALIAPPGLPSYQLKPRGIRLVDNAEVGHIEGSLSEALLLEHGCEVPPEDVSQAVAAIYFYEGHNIAIDDMQDNQDNDNDPYASLAVYFDGAMNYNFELGFVQAGNYTVAVTCETFDDPVEEDELGFFYSENLVVEQGETLVLNLPSNE